jgi:hypothetical protein
MVLIKASCNPWPDGSRDFSNTRNLAFPPERTLSFINEYVCIVNLVSSNGIRVYYLTKRFFGWKGHSRVGKILTGKLYHASNSFQLYVCYSNNQATCTSVTFLG